MSRFLKLSWIALLGSASAAQPPLVVTGDPILSRVVSYGDLNLASKAGEDRLANRIRAAARDICFEDNVEQVKFTAARHDCYKTAVSGGFRQMNELIVAKSNGATIVAAALVVRGK